MLTSRSSNIPETYNDLMKPDENWPEPQDAAERRKIQNRLAQRAYSKFTPQDTLSALLITATQAAHTSAGRNMRDRTKEVKMLREEIKQLREMAGTPEAQGMESNMLSQSPVAGQLECSSAPRSPLLGQ